MSSAIFFEEKQVNPRWMGWLVIFVGVGSLTFVLVELSNRWYTTGSVAELVAGSIGVALICGTIAWLAFTHHLAVSIDKRGITYLYPPSINRSKRINVDELESFELRKVTVSELFATSNSSHSIRKKSLKKEVCTISGWTVADLHLRDGRQVLLGTRNPDGMLWALKRLQSPG